MAPNAATAMPNQRAHSDPFITPNPADQQHADDQPQPSVGGEVVVEQQHLELLADLVVLVEGPERAKDPHDAGGDEHDRGEQEPTGPRSLSLCVGHEHPSCWAGAASTLRPAVGSASRPRAPRESPTGGGSRRKG